MKKLLILFSLILFTSCISAQEPYVPIIIDVPLEVSYITDSEMGLFSRNTGHIIKVDPHPLVIEHEYWFWIEIDQDKKGNTLSGRILDYEITCKQANLNIKEKEKMIKLTYQKKKSRS